MDAPHLTDPHRAGSKSLLWHRLGSAKVLSLHASVSPLVNAGVVTTWGKEGAGPSCGTSSWPGLGSLPKPAQCPAALQEAQALLGEQGVGLRWSMLGLGAVLGLVVHGGPWGLIQAGAGGPCWRQQAGGWASGPWWSMLGVLECAGPVVHAGVSGPWWSMLGIWEHAGAVVHAEISRLSQCGPRCSPVVRAGDAGLAGHRARNP